MKKYVKVIFFIIVAFVVIILFDTLQARILKNSPVISWNEKLADSDSWVDRGILMDTYYCTREKDIVTVSWHFKTSKFNCPIDDIIEPSELENISMEIKEETLTKTGVTIIIKDLSGKENTYGEFYRIDKKIDGKWVELQPIIDNYGFNSIGYLVNENNELELKHNWEWLYGELDSGEYRLVKEVNHKYFSVYFEIV